MNLPLRISNVDSRAQGFTIVDCDGDYVGTFGMYESVSGKDITRDAVNRILGAVNRAHVLADNLREVFRFIGKQGTCSRCKEHIVWIRTWKGKYLALNKDCTVHKHD